MTATNTTLNAGEISTPQVTLDGTNADTITFSLFTPYIQIIWDGTGTGGFTVDGSTPTVGGANTNPLPASACVQTIRLGPSRGRNPVVKIISGSAAKYTVTAIQSPATP